MKESDKRITTVRMHKDLKRQLGIMANKKGLSLNALVLLLIQKALKES